MCRLVSWCPVRNKASTSGLCGARGPGLVSQVRSRQESCHGAHGPKHVDRFTFHTATGEFSMPLSSNDSIPCGQ